MRQAAALIVLAFLTCSVSPAEDVPAARRLLERSDIRAAVAAARQNEPDILRQQVELAEIPAPLGREQRRGAAVRTKFEALGLKNVRTDPAGNVLGDRPGRNQRPRLVLAAHLDTVFPEGTNVKTTTEGRVIKGPGIGDDSRGLAVLLGVVRALDAGKVVTDGTITFVADVGEEGLGDLRGMKELFDRTLHGEVDCFVSIDGSGLDITNGGVGSHRYRVTLKGPGGHSYGDFGLVNPIHALGRAIAQIAETQVPSEPRTTFNVGRIGGGTSVNSIPYEAWMEVDMRSVDPGPLGKVDDAFQKAVRKAVQDENARWGNGSIKASIELVGDRPAARTPDNSAIVRSAVDVTQALGNPSPSLGAGSTDANYPMSLGIPAITIGGGGSGRGAHSLGEMFDTTDSWRGTARALVLAVALVSGGDAGSVRTPKPPVADPLPR